MIFLAMLALLIAGAVRGDGPHAEGSHHAHAAHAAAAHGHQHHHAHVLDLGTTPPSRAITLSFIALVVFTIAFEHLEHRMMHALSKQGRIVFAGYDDNKIIAWDTMTGGKLKDADHENRVSCVGVSSNGHALATGSWDMSLKIWS